MRRILIGLIGAALLGLIGFSTFAWRNAIATIVPPSPSSFAAATIAQGGVLASAGYCATCHTAKGGRPYAGGYPLATPFGTIYSTNITPDPETGIGRWPESAFRRALQEGVARDGSHLYPAFPFDHFTKLTDRDIGALYAFMMTRPPVRAVAMTNTVPFPLNVRMLQAGWKLLYFTPGRYQPKAAKGAEWNRGAYLAEGVSHCGACHTPRGRLGAEDSAHPYAGALIDGWIAPPLDTTNTAPLVWSQPELIAYLTTGVTVHHGTAAGPMGAVSRGVSALPASDIAAIATYFASSNGSAARAGQSEATIRTASARDAVGMGLQYDPTARLYAAACSSCHFNGAVNNPLRPDLALNPALSMDDPTNLIRVIMYGINAPNGAPGVVMPGFAGFTNTDITRLAAWLRATRTNKPAWTDLQKKVATIRAEGRGND